MNSYNLLKQEGSCENPARVLKNMILANGISYPSDEELVGIILSGTMNEKYALRIRSAVMDILRTCQDESLVKKLMGISGMSEDRSLMMASCVELGRRMNCHRRHKISRPLDVIPFVKHYTMDPRENFITISLNGASEILNIRVTSIGIVDRALIHPREIFAEPVCEHASAVICCHNHPQGHCIPSNEDIQSTRTLKKAAEVLGITFLDHIIITAEDYFSFMENNLL